ncbi:nitroreductase family deazaflavin-dependent oxidoreductase [Agromyces archimandritae]|uniref:Nitroreductase family deazaflavin-dependent oxidoreductase n=1 Tax=Agromyces archimandritae TaxID=2781962 RepID=A0A975FQ33_9MICO|nr:nitroreductase family deazaflavin-dependent oxidoreductase [Agromyces archimandritae]QTX05623.1 nitroreductase family deazaflavin-dependent oxidoreductase [Agromyces archimandritae]
MGGFGDGFLRVLSRTLNPITMRAARRGRGPFSLIIHSGRKSGRRYETPVILARVPEGFVAELTYGPEVDWYRNIVAAGGCRVLRHGEEHVIDGISEFDSRAGRAAFGPPASWLLALLGRHEFRLLHEAGGASGEASGGASGDAGPEPRPGASTPES